MMASFLTRGLSMVLGYAYPAYECFKTVEKNKPEVEQLRFWCQYWILVAVLTVFERFSDAFISWLPMYSEAKLAFFVYLWYPKTRGTTYVYDTFLRPYVAKHETEIDRNLMELRTRAGDIAVLYWQKAASYGQTRIFEVLQHVALQSPTPRPAQLQRRQARVRQRPPTTAARQPATQQPPQPAAATCQPATQQPPQPAAATRQPATQQPQQPAAATRQPPTQQPPQLAAATRQPSTQQPPQPAAATRQPGTQQPPQPAGATHQPATQQPPQSPERQPASIAAATQEREPAKAAPSPAPPTSNLQTTAPSLAVPQANNQLPPPSEEEAMQIETASVVSNGGADPPPQETVMEETIRVTRGRLRRKRTATNPRQ